MSSSEPFPQLDRYDFVRRLSANSLAEGWEAALRGNGRRCFVKTPARGSDISSSEQVKALTNSFRLQGRIHYGGVLRATACHRHGDTCYVVYPFIDSADYRFWSPDGWSEEQTEYLFQASLTIDLLHSLGLVHCDLKLENFSLRRRGLLWRPTLIDLDFLWEAGTRRPAWIAGTPGRIAPEVLEGGELNARTDLYSFGQSLRGVVDTPGFQAEGPVKLKLRQLVDHLTQETPERRPTSMIEALREAGLIDDSRFVDFRKRALTARLAGAFRAERVNLRREGFDLQRRVFFTCGIYSLPDDFVQDLGSAYRARPRLALDVFMRFWTAAEIDQYGDFWQARVSDDLLYVLFEELAPFRSPGDGPGPVHLPTRSPRKSAGLREFLYLRQRWRDGHFRAIEREEQREVLGELGDLATRLRRPDEATEYMRALLEMLGTDDPRYLSTAHKLVVQLFSSGRQADGEAELDKARQALGPDHPAAVRALDRAGVWLLVIQGKIEAASKELERIAGEARAHGETLTLVKAIGDLGTVARQRGELVQAMELFEECRRLAKENDLTSEIGYILGNFASLCYQVGDLQRALKIAKETEAVAVENDQPYLRRSSYIEQAIAHIRLGDYGKAEHWLGMMLNETHLQAGPYAYAVYYNTLGWINTVRCRIRQARTNIDKGMVLAERAGLDLVRTQLHKNLSYLALMEGNRDEFTRVMELCRSSAHGNSDTISLREIHGLEVLSTCIYDTLPAEQEVIGTIRELIAGYCLSYAGLFYLQALAGRADSPAVTVRRAINQEMRQVFTGQGPIAHAVNLCIDADDCGDDWEAAATKLKAALAALDAADYKFTSALLCERLADSLREHDHPKLANRFLAYAHTLAAGLSNNVMVARVSAKQDEGQRLTYEKSALLEAIDGVSNIMENLDNYPNALEHMVRFAVRVTEAERGVLLTRESPQAPLQVRTYVNFDSAALRDVTDISLSSASAALNIGKPLIVRDALADDRTRKSKSILAYNVRSIICVPIVSHEHIDAVIYLDHHTIPALFDEDDVRYIQSLSRFLSVVLRAARDQKSAEARREYLEKWSRDKGMSSDFLTADPSTLDMLDTLQMVAESRVNILLYGESGTGKEILCHKIHEMSGRGHRPLIALNCAAIPPTLVESELFGIVKGAASGVEEREGKFEAADGGTLFLDEIGEMSLEVQAKLLRVIEHQGFARVGSNKTINVDVRFIFATNRDLNEMVKKKLFREDLLHRLSVVRLEIPPLRERIVDIPLLVDHFSQIPSANFKGTIQFSDRAMTYLEAYSWPGNVRRLQNLVEGLRIMYPGQTIGVKQLSPDIVADFRQSENTRRRSEQAERARILAMLNRTRGNISKTARELDVPVTSLRRKIKKYGLNNG